MKTESAEKVEDYTNEAKIKLTDIAEIKNLYEECEIQSEIIKGKETIIKDLRSKLEILKNNYDNLNTVNDRNHELEKIVNSSTVRIALKLKKIISPLIFLLKKFYRVFSYIKKMSLALIKKIIKYTYRIFLPKKIKRTIKTKALQSRKISKLIGFNGFNEYNPDILYSPENNTSEKIYIQTSINKTIGIHLHLYYEDLLDEFYNYLQNIPYIFDLYVSVQKNANVKKIKNKFKKIPMLNYVEVQESENSGRDFGPMFVLFAKKLKNYDYIMHIHSKKSLGLGKEQISWRRYLLHYLLGSTEIIMKCFYLMENKNIGLIYPDAHKSLSAWAHAWLDEKPLAIQLMKKIGIKYKDELLEFSAGSMFWANKKAIEPLLDLNLTWEDFGKEKNQTGGTLEYVFERIPGLVTRNQGYDIAIYNEKYHKYLLNKGTKNIDRYFKQNLESAVNLCRNFNIISFNIFDTLITRKIYNPEDIFVLIEKKLYNTTIHISDFASKRKEAEHNVRKKKNFKGDCSIDEIYNELMLNEKLSKKEADTIKEIETQLEIKLCIPKKDSLKIYNTLLKEGKKIFLISDMYLTREILEKILNKCGYYNYFDILVSSELGRRKDDGTMWKYFFNKYKISDLLHVGDNEQSDVNQILAFDRTPYYILNGIKMFSISRYWINKKFNIYESVMMGCIINKSIFNSPFALNNYPKKSLINTEFDFGYSILGPLVLEYFIWLINDLKESNQKEVLLFASRKGYFLQKIYNHILQKIKNEKINNIEQHYLYISRRAISVANIENIEDVYEILEKHYKGTIIELLYYRLGFKENSIEDRLIELPRDFEIIKQIIEDNFEKILENAKNERENYIKYIEENIFNIEDKNLNFIDIGFAGTEQYYLSLLLKKKITGKYFAVSNNLKPLALGCKVDSCYNDSILNSKEIHENTIYRNKFLLERFFTAPHGQLKYIDKDANPVFTTDKNTGKIEKIEKIYDGIIEFIDDIYEIFKDDLLKVKLDKKLLISNYQNFLRESNLMSDDMKKIFDVDDYFCSNGIINALDIKYVMD